MQSVEKTWFERADQEELVADDPVVLENAAKEEKVYVASHWKLMWWRFLRHKLAIVSAILILLLYLVAAFCEFVAPYDPEETFVKYKLAPPSTSISLTPKAIYSGHLSTRSCASTTRRPCAAFTQRILPPVTRSASLLKAVSTRCGDASRCHFISLVWMSPMKNKVSYCWAPTAWAAMSFPGQLWGSNLADDRIGQRGGKSGAGHSPGRSLRLLWWHD